MSDYADIVRTRIGHDIINGYMAGGICKTNCRGCAAVAALDALVAELADYRNVNGEQYDYDTLLFKYGEKARDVREYQGYARGLRARVTELETANERLLKQRVAALNRAEAAEAEVARLQIALSLHPNTQAFLKQTELREAAEARVTELEAAMRQILDGEDPIRIAREMDDARAALADKEGTP